MPEDKVLEEQWSPIVVGDDTTLTQEDLKPPGDRVLDEVWSPDLAEGISRYEHMADRDFLKAYDRTFFQEGYVVDAMKEHYKDTDISIEEWTWGADAVKITLPSAIKLEDLGPNATTEDWEKYVAALGKRESRVFNLGDEWLGSNEGGSYGSGL